MRRSRVLGVAVGRRIFRDVRRLTSFTEDIRAAGMAPDGRTLSLRIVRSATPCRLLRRRRLLELRRLRFADGAPVCLENTYLPLELAAAVGGRRLRGSLYAALARRGERLARSEELLRVRAATPAERRLLRLPPAVPVVEIARLAFDRKGRPREFTRNVLHGERYLYYFELERRR